MSAKLEMEGKMKAVVFESGDRLIVNTAAPDANMMHDGSRPFALCERVSAAHLGRVTTKGRYETLAKAKAALRRRA